MANYPASGTEIIEKSNNAVYTYIHMGGKIGVIAEFSCTKAETAANAVNIYAHGNTIVVENATEEISVYDAMGRLVCRDAARHVSTVAESGIRAEIRVSGAGVYIVKVGAEAKRVMGND